MDVMIPISQLSDMLVIGTVVCMFSVLVGGALGTLIETIAKHVYQKHKEKKAAQKAAA